MSMDVSPRHTRLKNATQHPGIPDIPAKRPTTAEKKADDQALADAEAVKEAALKQAVLHMGKMENKMAAEQRQAATPVKPVRPHPKVVKKALKAVKGKGTPTPSAVETKLTVEVDDNEEAPGVDLARQRVSSSTLMICEAIKSARKHSTTVNLAQKATLFFLNLTCNLTRSDMKNALAGCVTNWASFVPTGKTLNISCGSSVVSGVTVPPPSSQSVSTTDTKATTVSCCLPQAPPPTLDIQLEDTEVGGFGDNEQDDALEHAAALLSLMKHGKPPADSAVRISTKSTAPFTDASKSKTIEVPSHKRKAPELEEEYVLTSEVEFTEEDDNEDDIQMDMGNKGEDIEVEEVRNSRTTTQTSVMIVQNPAKKVKVELVAKSQIPLSSAIVMTQMDLGVSFESSGSLRPSTSRSSAGLGIGLGGEPLTDIFKQTKWRRELVPTLVLWAGAQCDVWNITKQQIIEVLNVIMPVVYVNQPHCIGQLTMQSKAVAIAYQ
ncbi:hypothetical protein PAXRUDRAFT_14924 [Paxillus rubicundulus Ve08.2h10]|uniref:Uncharacterized protein n=1 Tax=Paxillus rubicundulus Ve08.2h10 TaxID=930991 RepID=A0A0D0CH83_9AGAM|nr:hypothetical protein PAXRUDRAFT_14924 [Paxillus rubicundulus Ve08.2h10]